MPLFLTPSERKIFDTLDASVRDGVTIEEEKKTFTDSEANLNVRMRNMRLEHPELKKLQEESKNKKYTANDVAKIAETIDLSTLSKNDMIELAFAWGPNMFTHMIGLALPAVSSKDDLAHLGNLAGMRHGLLLSLA